MSSGNKTQLAVCLEQHLELSRSNDALGRLGRSLIAVAGNEDFQNVKDNAINAMSAVGRGLFAAGKWVGGNTLDLALKGFTAAGNQLAKSFSENGTLIKNVLKDVAKTSDKDLKIAAPKAALITVSGDAGQILHDMETLVKTLELWVSHNKDVMDYLDKELITLKKLKSAKKAEQIHAIIEEFEGLKYPAFKLGNSMGKAVKSDTLPGGRTFIFSDEGTPKYSMGGDAPSGEAKTISMSQGEISDIMNKLDKVNDLLLKVKESYDGYTAFIKSWADMVKGVDGNLSQLDKVSKTILGECEKLMSGNQGALAFYSGFTPRVVGYVDKYIHGVLGVFA